MTLNIRKIPDAYSIRTGLCWVQGLFFREVLFLKDVLPVVAQSFLYIEKSQKVVVVLVVLDVRKNDWTFVASTSWFYRPSCCFLVAQFTEHPKSPTGRELSLRSRWGSMMKREGGVGIVVGAVWTSYWKWKVGVMIFGIFLYDRHAVHTMYNMYRYSHQENYREKKTWSQNPGDSSTSESKSCCALRFEIIEDLDHFLRTEL